MMFKDMVDEILRQCRASNDKTFRKTVEKLVNLKYFELCKGFSVNGLRDMITLDFTTATDSGLWLPSDLLGIDCARDEDDVEFFERNRGDAVEEDQFGYKYYRYKGDDDPLVEGSDLTIDQDAASFRSVTVDAYITASGAIDDEYIRIGTEPGFYQITSETSPYAITPTYHGPALTDALFRIRPEETERMVILDADETILKDREMDVYYWKSPRPLYRDSDLILLPSVMALQLTVLRELPEAKSFRPVSQNELDAEIAKMHRDNPEFLKPSTPRDKHDNIMDLSVSRKFYSLRNE